MPVPTAGATTEQPTCWCSKKLADHNAREWLDHTKLFPHILPIVPVIKPQ